MTKKFHFLELDDVSRDYLLAVRDSRGAGMPGIYIAQSNWLPLIGFLSGAGLLIAVVIITFATNIILGDPLNVAMLQTAGLLLGGWMMIAAIRVWMVSGGRRHAGHFLWVDALRLWEASGSKVNVTELSDMEDCNSTDNYNEGTYQNTAFELKLPEGMHTFTVPNQHDAERLMRFFAALNVFREVKTEQGESHAAAEIGSMARDIAFGEPPTLEAVDEPAPREEAMTLPEPHRAQRPPSGLIAYLAIVGAAVALVFLLRQANVGLRDEAIFQLVKDSRADNPLAYRSNLGAYLVDARNTRHRDEVKNLLILHYAPAIQRVRENGRDPELKDCLLTILERIKTEPTPLISIRVREDAKELRPEHGLDVVQTRFREELAQRELGERLCQTVGDDLVVLVQAPEDVPAMIEVIYRFVPTGNQELSLEWECRMRTGPDDDQPKSKKRDPQRVVMVVGVDIDGILRTAAQQTVMDLAGEPPPNAAIPLQQFPRQF